MHRCPKCGLKIGSMQVHTEEVCEEQKATNDLNKGISKTCYWCGGIVGDKGGSHKTGCPELK